MRRRVKCIGLQRKGMTKWWDCAAKEMLKAGRRAGKQASGWAGRQAGVRAAMRASGGRVSGQVHCWAARL